MTLKQGTIRFQVTLILFATTFFTLVVVGGIFLLLTMGYTRNLGRLYIEDAAERLSQTIIQESETKELSPDELQNLIRQHNLPMDLRVNISNETGRPLFPDHEVQTTSPPLSQWIINSLNTTRGFRDNRRPGTTNPHSMMMNMGPRGFISPTSYQMSLVSGNMGYIIQLNSPQGILTEITTTAAKGFLLAATLSLLITGIVAIFTARLFSGPIQNLTRLVLETPPEGLTTDPEIFKPNSQIQTAFEISSLHSGFYHFSKRISQLYSNLEQERDSLKMFLADASHELRSPLMAAQTFLELEKDTTHYHDLQRQLQRMNKIVSSLLTLSRVEGGIVSIDFQQVHPLPILQTLLADLSATYDNVSLEIQLEGELKDELTLWGDKNAIHTIFQNILENAFLYGFRQNPEGSKTLRLKISGEWSDSFTKINIQDAGPGMDDHEIPLAGTRFFRGTSGKKSTTGLGLGLSTAKALAIKMNGQLSFSSSSNGFSVTLSLPNHP